MRIEAHAHHSTSEPGIRRQYKHPWLSLDFSCPTTADKQTTARTIRCIQNPLLSPISIISKQILLLQHSEICGNFRPPPRCFHAYVQKKTTDHIHIHAMLEPATAPWGLGISDADFKKLSAGFEPEDMDDKFRISVFDQSQSGNVSIHVIRVTGERELCALFVNPNNGGNRSGGVIIEAITWEQNKSGIRLSEEQAKKEVVMITRNILQCDYDALPAYDSDEMFNHPGARIGAK